MFLAPLQCSFRTQTQDLNQNAAEKLAQPFLNTSQELGRQVTWNTFFLCKSRQLLTDLITK